MSKIIGLGEWFPSTVRKNSDWPQETVEAFRAHYQRELANATAIDHSIVLDPWTTAGFMAEVGDPFVGTKERRVADVSLKSWDAETFAAEEALKEAGIDKQEIGAVMSYAFAPDMIHGDSAAMVITNLGLDNAYGVAVSSMCSSIVNQLAMAKALINSGDIKFALLTQSNLMTRGVAMGHPSSPSVGDAATAIIVGPDSYSGHKILNAYSRTVKNQYDAVVWRRKDANNQGWYNPGEGYYLGSFSPDKAKGLVQQTLPVATQTTKEALQELNLDFSNLDFFTSVQPRKWIPAGIAQMMGLKESQTIDTFEKHAHLGVCGPLVCLLEARRQNKLTKGNIIGMYGQGAGFTRATALIEW